MPDFLHRTTKQLLKSIAAADLPEAIGNYIQSPDLSAVVGFDSKYWDISGDVISLKDQAGRDAVDATELVAFRDALADDINQLEFMRAFALALLDEINVLRAALSLTPRTPGELKTAVRSKMDA